MKETDNSSITSPAEIARLAALYDIYGALIKESQREIFEEYVLDNLSLAEIANTRDITRQGVYDIIKRTQKKLKGYEDKLGLLKKSIETDERLERLEAVIDGIGSGTFFKSGEYDSIKKLVNEIRSNL